MAINICYPSLALLAIAVMIVGCGPRSDGPKRVLVSGNVTYANEPIVNGEIRFEPLDGKISPVGSAIIQGSYKVSARGGVPAGSNRVVIHGYRPPPNTRMKTDSHPQSGKPAVQYVPAKYNTNSQLQITLDSEEDQKTLDFDLEP